MLRSQEAWPTTRWDLSAPGSYVLLNGPGASGAEAFKLAVLDLVARGVLGLVKTRRRGVFGRHTEVSILTAASRAAPVGAPELRSVLEVFERQRSSVFEDGAIGVPVADFARAAGQRFGSIQRYAGEVLQLALIDRGLYREQRYQVLWIFPRTRWVPTARGEAARADLEQRLELGRADLGGWVRGDLPRAVAFAGLAGASLLLASELYPDLQQLDHELARYRDSDGGSSSSGSSGDASGWQPEREGEPLAEGPGGLDLAGLDFAGLDLGGLDLGALSFDFDFGAFEGIGEAFAIDAGVDSGGGGDGGDGGGGDSGGGGDGGGGGD